MTKTKQDFEYWTGEDKNLVYTITDENAASVNMAGMTCRWVLQDEPDSGSLLVYQTSGSGVAVSGCTVTVTIAGSDTTGCSIEGTFYTDLSASDSSGNVAMLAVGYANVHRRGY
jgi:hypothetical protein